MKPMIKRGMTLLGLVLLLVLAACGPAPESVRDWEQPGAEPVVEQVIVKESEARAPLDEGASSGYDSEGAEIEQMIIWNADLSLTVEDTKEAMAQIQAVARDLGGRTTGSESWLANEQLHARLTIRVPADRFEEAMAQLRDLAIKVSRESANSEDVTDQYVDLASRLRHLEAKEAQLLEFMNEADDTEDVLAVYEHLAETQSEIELVKGRMAYLEDLAAMATINVELFPEEAAPTVIEERWRPGFTLRSAARTLVNTLEGLADAIIWFVAYLLPILLLISLPLVALIWAIRRWRRRRQGSRAEEE